MEKYVELVNRQGYTLRGFLHRPQQPGMAVPMVLMYHGYSASKTNPLYVEAARQLATRGIASLRFDFMGSGDSDGRFQDMSIETEIADGIDILRYAQSLPFVDPNRIALLGTSYGGLVAAIIAGRLPNEIKAQVLWCPAIISIRDARAGKAGTTDITAVLTEGTADVNGLLVGKRFLEDNRALEFETEASAYQGRTLIIWGDQDPIVPPDIIAICEAVYENRLEKCMIEGVGHMFETHSARVRLLEASYDFLQGELVSPKKD